MLPAPAFLRVPSFVIHHSSLGIRSVLLLSALLLSSLLLATSTPAFAADPFVPTASAEPGDLVWALDLTQGSPLPADCPTDITWEQTGPKSGPCLKVVFPSTVPGDGYLTAIPYDVRQFRGMLIQFKCDIRTQDVLPIQPSQPRWMGAMCSLAARWENDSGGTNTSFFDVWGTLDWHTYTCNMTVDRAATTGTIYLGMRGYHGTAWFTNLRIHAVRRAPVRPAPDSAWRPDRHDPRRGFMNPGTFYRDYFPSLAAFHANLLRWQLITSSNDPGTAPQFDPVRYDTWLDGQLTILHDALDAAQAQGLKLAVVMMTPPGGYLDNGTQALLSDAAWQAHFIAAWQKIATRLNGHPALYGYDLLNEPHQIGFAPAGLQDWLGVQVAAARAIRAIDLTTPICLEVNGSDVAPNFAWLDPIDVPGIIYSVHMYTPMEFTHQGIQSTWEPNAHVPYPGTLNGQPFNKDFLRAHFQPVREFQLAHRVPIYVGEFSAARWAPGADRYLADCIELFEEYGWDWSYHAFREYPGWSTERSDLPYAPNGSPLPAEPTARLELLRTWFAKNPAPSP